MNHNNEDLTRKLAANEFVRVNGLTMRMIVLLFKVKWFRFNELDIALASNKLDSGDIYETLDYFESQGYIEVRNIDTKQVTKLADSDIGDIEFKLTGEGKKVAYGIRTDDAIDL